MRLCGGIGPNQGIIFPERESNPNTPEASLMVPDFTISVNSSSRNYLLVCLILAPFLSLSIYWPPRKAAKRELNQKGEIVKSGTIILDPGLALRTMDESALSQQLIVYSYIHTVHTPSLKGEGTLPSSHDSVCYLLYSIYQSQLTFLPPQCEYSIH